MTARKNMGVREGIREGTPHYPSEPKGDEGYRFYFPDPEEFRAAMIRARQLDLAKCPRRAWRVRMNLDGTQPTYVAPVVEVEVEVEEPLVSDKKRRGPQKTPKLPRPPRDREAERRRRLIRENKGKL